MHETDAIQQPNPSPRSPDTRIASGYPADFPATEALDSRDNFQRWFTKSRQRKIVRGTRIIPFGMRLFAAIVFLGGMSYISLVLSLTCHLGRFEYLTYALYDLSVGSNPSGNPAAHFLAGTILKWTIRMALLVCGCVILRGLFVYGSEMPPNPVEERIVVKPEGTNPNWLGVVGVCVVLAMFVFLFLLPIKDLGMIIWWEGKPFKPAQDMSELFNGLWMASAVIGAALMLGFRAYLEYLSRIANGMNNSELKARMLRLFFITMLILTPLMVLAVSHSAWAQTTANPHNRIVTFPEVRAYGEVTLLWAGIWSVAIFLVAWFLASKLTEWSDAFEEYPASDDPPEGLVDHEPPNNA